VPPLEQDVVGLDVAVHDPLGVRMGQGLGHLPGDLERLVDGELPLAGQAIAQ
jgi:hypothetical protein